MKGLLHTFLSSILLTSGFAQTYTSWLTGNASDLISQPQGGVCLMGGASENDAAMTWFLDRCDGGDVLVLRATGADGYNDYLFNGLGVTVNSVETIRFDDPSAAFDNYIKDKISKAEGIWIAGGDQWDYVSYWRDTPVDSLINKGITQRNIVIGGISAGMAIQGSHYFTAQYGTVTSATALSNPYSAAVAVSSLPFIQNQWLENVITDTHYDNPDRKGRHSVFMARTLKDDQLMLKGIACNEYTAVCIDPAGLARVFGEITGDIAYFIQPNCELADPSPETCELLTPLTWDHGGQALKVYQINGNMNGTGTFDLSDWTSAGGGTWKHWSIQNGVLAETSGTAPDCGLSLEEQNTASLGVYPNPVTITEGRVRLISAIDGFELLDSEGRILKSDVETTDRVSVAGMSPGIYFIRTEGRNYKLIITD